MERGLELEEMILTEVLLELLLVGRLRLRRVVDERVARQFRRHLHLRLHSCVSDKSP